MDIKVNVIIVEISKVSPNPWNPNRQSDFIFEKEINSIKEKGFLVPVLVREKKKGFYEIIDGEHRWKAAKILKMKKIPVNNLGVIDDIECQSLTILLNEVRGKADSQLMADLLMDIEKQIGREELERIMPFTEIEIDHFINTALLDFESISSQEPKNDSINDDFKTISFRLPKEVADQLEEQIKRFKKALYPEDDPKDVSIIQPIEAICQHLAQISDDQLL